jgi:hypothetical protein
MARLVARFKAAYRLNHTALQIVGLLHYIHPTQRGIPSIAKPHTQPRLFVWNEYSVWLPRNIVWKIHKLLILLTNLLWIFKYSNILYKYAHTREPVFKCKHMCCVIITHIHLIKPAWPSAIHRIFEYSTCISIQHPFCVSTTQTRR